MLRRSKPAHEFSGLRRAAASAGHLTLEEEQALARAAQRGDAKAFERLVVSHIHLVFAMAAEYSRFGSPMNELVSEGLLALTTAARRFDPDRGARLAVYAAHWIRAYLRRFTLSNRRMVGPPSTRQGRALLATMARTERALTQAIGVTPDSEALARHLGVSAHEVDEVKLALHGRDKPVSDTVRPEGSSVALVSDEPTPECVAERNERERQSHALLSRAFETLESREREILRARSLRDDAPSLTELGAGFGISGERVRQIEVRGFQKLRAAVLECVA